MKPISFFKGKDNGMAGQANLGTLFRRR